MTMSEAQRSEYHRAAIELEGLEGWDWLAIEDGVVVYVASDHVYMVAQQGRTIFWTNDLPLIIPEVLTPGAAATRSEHMERCRGKGRCYSWCKEKRSKPVVQASAEQEVEEV